MVAHDGVNWTVDVVDREPHTSAVAPPPRPKPSTDAHPVALVRRRIMASGLERWLLLPLGDLTPRLFRYSRRGARLAERLAGDRPALTLSSALAELAGQVGGLGSRSATPLPRVLVDKLAFALHRFIDDEGKDPPEWGFVLPEGTAPSPVLPELRMVLVAVEELMQRLERQGFQRDAIAAVQRRRTRVTLDEGPPAGFFFTDDPGAVPAGMLLALDDVDQKPLSFVGVRGPLQPAVSQWYAADRIKDIIVEPLFDEAPRLRRMAGGRFGALLAALDELVVVDVNRPRLVWVYTPDLGRMVPLVRGEADAIDVGRSGRAQLERIEQAVRALPFATDADRAFAEALRTRGRLDGLSAQHLVNHTAVEDKDGHALRVVEGRLQIVVGDDGLLRLTSLGHRLAARDLADDGATIVHDGTGRRLIVVVADQQERALARAVEQVGDAPLPPALLAQITTRLKRGRVDVQLPSSVRGRQTDPAPLTLVKVAFVARGDDPLGGGARFTLVSRPLKNGPTFLPGEGPTHVFADDDDGRPIWCGRDLDDEARRAQRLLAISGPDGTALDDDAREGAWSFALRRPDEALDTVARLFARDDVDIAVAGEVLALQRARSADLKVRLSSRVDWLGVDGGVAINDGERLALRSIIDALRGGRRYVLLDKSRVVVLDDALRDQLGSLGAFAANDKGDTQGLKLPAGAAATVLADLGDAADSTSVGDLIARLDRAADVDGLAPAGLLATLRPYQEEGLRFLRRLAALGTGGVLADDMGLGKTLTTTALLLDRMTMGPQLVVAPTSLAYHWARELERFAPSLRPIVLADVDGGAARVAAARNAGPGDVVIASYGLVLRDIDGMAEVAFATLVVDEAQAIKNATTARAKALRRLRAELRFALTGTPLENHTGEVWSIIDLVAPGLFGTFAQFKARFADPIEKDEDRARRRLLARALRPFVLRRTKAEVAKDLPEKTERTLVLTPSPEERAAYERLRKAIVVDLDERGVFNKKRRDDDRAPLDKGQSRVQVLSALTRLRLAACHPALVDDVVDLDGAPPGTKQAALVASLLELREQGHCALVFSQFVRHLRLAERFATEAGLRTLRLTGETATRERQVLVDRFQAGEADAFFISLKAGGFGLNLTRATYVVHLDPWWNPATETQASDRAHRIGQTLPVTVVRLVMADTIEAPILEMHGHKRALADAILEGTDAAGRLSLDDLQALLSHTRRTADDDRQEFVDVGP